MNESRFLWLSLSLLLLLGKAKASCLIPKRTIATNHVFLSYENNVWNLLQSDIVPVSRSIYLLCGGGTAPRKFDCDVYGSFSPVLPTTNCAKVFEQSVREDSNNPTCNTSPLATMYRVGYDVGNNQFLDLYRSCFDRRDARAVFVEHRVYAKTFFAQRPCMEFTRDGVISPADEASYKTRNIYETFLRLFGNQQNFIANKKDLVINRGHLAASADFLFGDQMCSTFKYVNAVPQFKAINDGNWEAIERYVRNSVTGNQFVKVRTGARDVLSLPSSSEPKNVFLSGNRNPVPLWMYKIVRDANNRPIVAFLTLNNIFARQRPPAPAFCQAINCPINLANNARSGFTFCCNPATFRP